MKNYRTYFLVFIVLAAIAAITAAVGYNRIASTVDVVVAKQDIQQDQVITNECITVSKIPRGAVQADTVTNPNILLNSAAAKGYIPAGTPLKLAMFQPLGKSGIASKLKPNQVALAVAKDLDTSCGGGVITGNMVNIKAVNAPKGLPVEIHPIADDIEVLSANDTSVILAVDKTLADTFINNKSQYKIVLELLPPKEEKK